MRNQLYSMGSFWLWQAENIMYEFENDLYFDWVDLWRLIELKTF